MVIEVPAVAPELDESEEGVPSEEVIDESLEHATHGLAEPDGDSPTWPPDDEIFAPASEHTIEPITQQFSGTGDDSSAAPPVDQIFALLSDPTTEQDAIEHDTIVHADEEEAEVNGTIEPAVQGLAWNNDDSPPAPPDDQIVALSPDHTVEPTTPQLATTNGTSEHTAQELAGTNGDSPAGIPDDQLAAPASERGVELEGDHWRERAIVWRERAIAAELVAKTLQGNVDDLRANVEDLRPKGEAAAVDDVPRTAAIAPPETPWRRFARDLYDKYLG